MYFITVNTFPVYPALSAKKSSFECLINTGTLTALYYFCTVTAISVYGTYFFVTLSLSFSLCQVVIAKENSFSTDYLG